MHVYARQGAHPVRAEDECTNTWQDDAAARCECRASIGEPPVKNATQAFPSRRSHKYAPGVHQGSCPLHRMCVHVCERVPAARAEAVYACQNELPRLQFPPLPALELSKLQRDADFRLARCKHLCIPPAFP